MNFTQSEKEVSQQLQTAFSKVILTLLTALLISTIFTGTAQAGPIYITYKSFFPPASVAKDNGSGGCEYLGADMSNNNEYNLYRYKCGGKGEAYFFIRSQGVQTQFGYLTCIFQVHNWTSGIINTWHHKVTPTEGSNSNLCVAYSQDGNNTWFIGVYLEPITQPENPDEPEDPVIKFVKPYVKP